MRCHVCAAVPLQSACVHTRSVRGVADVSDLRITCAACLTKSPKRPKRGDVGGGKTTCLKDSHLSPCLGPGAWRHCGGSGKTCGAARATSLCCAAHRRRPPPWPRARAPAHPAAPPPRRVAAGAARAPRPLRSGPRGRLWRRCAGLRGSPQRRAQALLAGWAPQSGPGPRTPAPQAGRGALPGSRRTRALPLVALPRPGRAGRAPPTWPAA
jgi:hypothetical protein